MAHSLRPVRAGDRLDTSAAMFNHLLRLLTEHEHRISATPSPLEQRLANTIKVKNEIRTDTIERGEIIPLQHSSRYEMWPDPDDTLSEACRCRAKSDSDADDPPKYSGWGVALEPIKHRKWGLVAVGGIALARLTDWNRTVGDNARQPGWADVHPDPDVTEREHRRLFPRSHGRAKILARGQHEGQGYALIDFSQPQRWVPVQAKTTPDNYVTFPPVADTQCYASHDAQPDPIDLIDVTWPAYRYPYGIAQDDLPTGHTGTCGWAYWNGEDFVCRHWPGDFLIKRNSSWQLYHPATDAVYGGSLSSLRFGVPEMSYAWGGDVGWKTINESLIEYYSDTILHARHLASHDDNDGELVIDPRPLLDAPNGEVRMLTNVQVTGDGPWPGWLWWLNQAHYQSDNARYLKGYNFYDPAPANEGGAWGHGPDEGPWLGQQANNHDLHMPTTSALDDWNEPPVAVAQTPYEPWFGYQEIEHTQTSNEPPWYAVAYAIRSNHHLAFP